MKVYVVLIHTLSLLALTGSTLGDHHTDHDCSHAHEREAKSLHDILADSLDKCFGKVDNLDLETLLNPDMEMEEHFTFFDQYCTKQDLIEDCLSKRTEDSSVCLNGTEDVTLEFVEDILKTALSYGCVAGGRYLGFLTYTVYTHKNSTSEGNDFTDCVATAKSTGVESNTMDASTRLLGFYREFKVFKQCLVNRMRGNNRAVFNAQLILNGIQRSMKCPHQDGPTSLCEALDTTPSTEESVCPYLGSDEEVPPRTDFFFDFVGECVELYFRQLNFDKLKTFTAVEEFRSFFKMYCDNRLRTVNSCLRDVSSDSKVCQNVTNHQVFEVYKYFIEYSLETGCKQDGSNVATIMNGIYNREQLAVIPDRVKECIVAAELMIKSNTTDSDSLSSNLLQVYRAANSVKQCILDHATDVNSFKTVFATFVDDVLGAAKCVNPIDGTIGLCQTLANI